MPPKLRGMINILAPLPANHTSSYLTLNDFFVKIIKGKKQTCTFRIPYDNIVVFYQIWVYLFYFFHFFIFLIQFHLQFIMLFHFFFEFSSLFMNYNFIFDLYWLVKVDNFFQWPIAKKKTCCRPHHCGLSRWSLGLRYLGSAILSSPLKCQHSKFSPHIDSVCFYIFSWWWSISFVLSWQFGRVF